MRFPIKIPLELKRVSAFPHRRRPQDPVGPFPYTEQTIAIPSADGVMLGATLSIPKGVIKPDVVVLVHGSGPATRDEEIAGHRVFAVLADHLLRQGIAVLRYDKRGISRSTGDYVHHTQSQLRDDLAAVVDALKARHEFGPLGLIGHSEGAQIAAAVTASKSGSVDFLVSLGGVGLPGTESGIAAALSEGGNKRVESVVVPSANHLFQTAKTGTDAEYGEIEETINPAVLNKISTFIRKP